MFSLSLFYDSEKYPHLPKQVLWRHINPKSDVWGFYLSHQGWRDWVFFWTSGFLFLLYHPMLAPPPSLPSNVPSNSVGHGLGFKTSQGKRWSSWRMVGSCKVTRWNELCWQGETVLCCDRLFPHLQWWQKKVILGEQCKGFHPLYEVWKGLQSTRVTDMRQGQG